MDRENVASGGSSDEGEIRDGVVEKATTKMSQFDGPTAERQDRNRNSISTSASLSPEQPYRSRDQRSTERSRSPYSDRQPRGSKRGREDDYSNRRDKRRFKVHYEESSQYYNRRSRVSYEDIDQGQPSATELRYDDRDRYPQNRHRTRSRSPYRANRGGDRNGPGAPHRKDGNRANGYGDAGRSSAYGRGDVRNRDTMDQSVSKRGQSPLPADNARQEAKTTQGFSQQYSNDHPKRSIELEK